MRKHEEDGQAQPQRGGGFNQEEKNVILLAPFSGDWKKRGKMGCNSVEFISLIFYLEPITKTVCLILLWCYTIRQFGTLRVREIMIQGNCILLTISEVLVHHGGKSVQSSFYNGQQEEEQ